MVGIGFFAPLPLAMMMPFMAGQSMIMGDAFGKAYQYGKRKISAMSNEEFNKLTPEKLATELQTDYMSMIPSLKASVVASRDFQTMIIKELAAIVPTMPGAIIEGLTSPESVQLPFTADAAGTTQKEYQQGQADSANNFLNQLAGFFKMMAGMGIKTVSNVQTGGFIETPEEQAAADKLALGIIEEQNAPDITTQDDAQWKTKIQAMSTVSLRAASDNRFNRKLNYTREQRDFIYNTYQKRLSTSSTDTTGTSAGAYTNARFTLVSEILTLKKRASIMGAGGSTIIAPQLYKARQALVKLITNARNVQSTKALANNDWNKRIWK